MSVLVNTSWIRTKSMQVILGMLGCGTGVTQSVRFVISHWCCGVQWCNGLINPFASSNFDGYTTLPS